MATTPAAKAASKFTPTLVHAYRRVPHMVPGPNGIGEQEGDVEVHCPCGEKIKFKSNAEGHVVGLAKTETAFRHLTENIPEAYIPYAAGENVPTKRVLAAEHKQEAKPEGKYVLRNGDQYVVLDDMDDDAVRLFAIDEAGIEPEHLPDALAGETLKKAVFNQLQTA